MASGWDDTPPPPPPNDTARLNGEVRVTSATGGQKGRKNARLGGADPGALMELARVYGYGEEKYARFNYLKGYDWSLSIDALYRHFLAFQSGEDRDPESGLLHTAHVAWHALALTAFLQRGLGTDDRPLVDPILAEFGHSDPLWQHHGPMPDVHGLPRDCSTCERIR